MKFRTVHLGYRSTPDYPYDYRVELVEYRIEERLQLTDWLDKLKIPHTAIGGSVLYLRKEEASLFLLRWS